MLILFPLKSTVNEALAFLFLFYFIRPLFLHFPLVSSDILLFFVSCLTQQDTRETEAAVNENGDPTGVILTAPLKVLCNCKRDLQNFYVIIHSNLLFWS